MTLAHPFIRNVALLMAIPLRSTRFMPTLQSQSQSQTLKQFHTSSFLRESKRKQATRVSKKTNQNLRLQRTQDAILNRADPVRGYPPGKDYLWLESDLKRILLEREKVWAFDPNTSADVLNFGLDPTRHAILEDLPNVASQRELLLMNETADVMRRKADEALAVEKEKAAVLEKLLSLKNANSMGIRVENVRRILATFGRVPDDSGSPEVQAAIQTYRIHTIADMLEMNPRDVHNRRSLRRLVSSRAKNLRYLKSISLQRYVDFLPRAGLLAEAVEGELVFRIEGSGVAKIDEYAR